MKKRKFFLLPFLLIFSIPLLIFLSNPTFAVWVKNQNNPIFSGTSGWWDSRDVQCSSIMIDDNIFKMWYGGNNGSGWKIGYATSKDGKSDWTKYNNPVIDITPTNEWPETDTTDPEVIKENNIYKMWYSSIISRLSGPDRFRIRYALSIDGKTWEEKDWVLKGNPGSWDSGGIARGISVLKSSNGYQMWYSGVNEAHIGTPEEKWQIGYATSLDGINWTKYPSNENPQPVIKPDKDWELNSVSYPHVIYDNGVYHMWYAATQLNLPIRIIYAYSTNGIDWIKPADKNPVLTIGNSESWEGSYIASPFVIKSGNKLEMWYDGLLWGSGWKIGIASGDLSDIFSSPLPPLVFLPGLGGSWNFESLVLGIEKPYSEWVITPGPGEKVYSGFLQTLKNAGYQDSGPQQNLFVFTYNWTKNVSQIANELKNFIQNTVKPQDQKIILVGHSLGGLISRAYVQTNPQSPIEKLLTLGSPHQGAVQVYYAWEGGDLRFMNILERIAIGLLLQIRRSGFTTNKETIQAIAPVLKDLLPTFNYLKQNGQEIDYLQMTEKNNWLITLNNTLPQPFPNFTSLLSNIPESTPAWLNVEPRNWLDKILGLWPDGKPVGNPILDTGDKTVLSKSAKLNGIKIVELNGLNHREIIQTKAGQEKIMQILNLSPTSYSISEDIQEPVLVFLIASPATIKLFDQNNNPVGEGNERLIFLPNAPEGTYQVEITGTDNGVYHLYLGQLTQNGDFWSEISGQITQGESQTRQIDFQLESPLVNPFFDPNGEIYFHSARQKILELKEYINNQIPSPKIKNALISKINSSLRLLNKNKTEQVITSFYETHLYIARLQKKESLPSATLQVIKNKILKIIADLEEVYIKTNTSSYPQHKLNTEIKIAEKFFEKMEKRLKNYPNATPEDGVLYLLAKEKLNKAKSAVSHQAHINALGARYLSLEGLILFSKK